MTTRADAARSSLEAAGLDPNALDPALLARRIGEPDGEAIARALGEVGDAATAAALRQIEPTVAPRSAVKAVRRALRRLAQRGIDVPPAPQRVRRAPARDPDGVALVSAVDGRGDRLIWLGRALPSGMLRLVVARLNEPGGLRDLNVTEVRRKELRRGRERLHAETKLRLVDAPFDVLDALVLEAWERAHPEGGHHDYPRLRSQLTSAPPVVPREPQSSRVRPLEETGVAALVADSGRLLTEPELAGWWPDPEAAAAALDEMDQLADSPLVLGREAQEQRLADIVRRAADALYPPATTARRLEGTAYVLAETGRVPAAERALAVAATLRGTPGHVRDVPLLAMLAHRGLGRLLAERRAARASERREALVLTPDEVRARSSSRRSRTRD